MKRVNNEYQKFQSHNTTILKIIPEQLDGEFFSRCLTLQCINIITVNCAVFYQFFMTPFFEVQYDLYNHCIFLMFYNHWLTAPTWFLNAFIYSTVVFIGNNIWSKSREENISKSPYP